MFRTSLVVVFWAIVGMCWYVGFSLQPQKWLRFQISSSDYRPDGHGKNYLEIAIGQPGLELLGSSSPLRNPNDAGTASPESREGFRLSVTATTMKLLLTAYLMDEFTGSQIADKSGVHPSKTYTELPNLVADGWILLLRGTDGAKVYALNPDPKVMAFTRVLFGEIIADLPRKKWYSIDLPTAPDWSFDASIENRQVKTKVVPLTA
jgi:hypothetical protein